MQGEISGVKDGDTFSTKMMDKYYMMTGDPSCLEHTLRIWVGDEITDADKMCFSSQLASMISSLTNNGR